MELTKEICQLIVGHLNSKTDICSLSRVSKIFQPVAERALYNTLHLQPNDTSISLCHSLATQDRLSVHVQALFVATYEEDEGLQERFWGSLASALQKTTRLRSLIFHINGDTAQAWLLRGCRFRLHTFHCDLSWDADLVSFLNTQHDIQDLCLADYQAPSTQQDEPAIPALHHASLPHLSMIESNYSEGIRDLVPGRPVVRVKTCFSSESESEKMEELFALTGALRQSRRPLVALELADSSYTENFTLIVLHEVSRLLPSLRYLGTLVLPVGKEVDIVVFFFTLYF